MFSRPVRIGLKPAPSAMSAPVLPLSSMRPLSGLVSPFSIFSSVVLPAPFRPMTPRHSPRASSTETLSSAQNSSARSVSLPLRPINSAAVSLSPYQSERLRSRQNFLETPSTRTNASPVMRSVAESGNQMRQRQPIRDPAEHQQQDGHDTHQYESTQVRRDTTDQPIACRGDQRGQRIVGADRRGQTGRGTRVYHWRQQHQHGAHNGQRLRNVAVEHTDWRQQ